MVVVQWTSYTVEAVKKVRVSIEDAVATLIHMFISSFKVTVEITFTLSL